MELFIILLLAGFGIYQLLRFNMRNGAETVRAYLFLSLLHDGMSVDQARQMANVDVSELDPRIISNTVAFVQEYFHGKQFPLIQAAYEKGMDSHFPNWYRQLKQI